MSPFTFLCLYILCIGSVSSLSLSVDPETNRIVDEHGRTRVFRGFNVVQKLHPYHPRLDKHDVLGSMVQEDFDTMREWGMNVVRLGVMWPGVEPERDQYNQTYLNVMKDLVTEMGQNGIYTMVDFHQDLFTGYFCGEGVPDYIVEMLRPVQQSCDSGMGIIGNALGLCKSFQEYNYSSDASTGYPLIEQCQVEAFTNYYMSPEVATLFDNFYNSDEAKERMALYFEQLAKTFSDSPYVIGYDLINEPFMGDVYNKFELLQSGVADLMYLQPLYERVHKAIRKYDTEKIIYYEANQVPGTVPLLGGIVNPVGFTQVPGGQDFNNRSVLSYHIYCCAIGQDACDHETGDVQPKYSKDCDKYVERKFHQRLEDTKNIGGGAFLTEFGACANTPACADEIDRSVIPADHTFQSWAYWQYKYNDDITTQSGVKEALFNEDGSVQELKLSVLQRSYAVAVDGTPIDMKFDRITKEFELEYETSTHSGETEVYLYQKRNERKLFVEQGTVDVVELDEHHVVLKHTAGEKQNVVIRVVSSGHC